MDFHFLDPEKTLIETAPDGTLRVVVEDDSCGMRVEAYRAFPLSYPEEYIALRDGGGREIGVLRDLREVAPTMRALVEEELRRRYFLPQITAIRNVTERFGSTEWDVETDRGPRRLAMRQINEAITEVSPERYLLTDVEGNRYEVKELSALDPESRARFLGKI
jgi:hypothetical protein